MNSEPQTHHKRPAAGVPGGRTVRVMAIVSLAAALGFILSVALGDKEPPPAHAEHGGSHVQIEPLARVQFPDAVFGHVMLRLDGTGPTRVAHVSSASDMVTLKVTVPPGDALNWHTHPGPGYVAIVQGTLTITYANECIPREYDAGEGLVDLGSLVHRADNFGDEDLVFYVTFLGIPAGTPPTIPFTGDPGC